MVKAGLDVNWPRRPARTNASTPATTTVPKMLSAARRRSEEVARDLFRLYAQDPRNELETGLFLLALDPRRRISSEPDYPSPRN